MCASDQEQIRTVYLALESIRDLQGNHLVYDEPPGSLILLAYLGLCPKDDPVFQNTCEMLYASDAPYAFIGTNFAELGCAHANHPWVLSFCNRILSATHTQTGIEQMLTMEMDNGLACESIDEYTGKAKTGEAFATCAGLYAYTLMRIFCE